MFSTEQEKLIERFNEHTAGLYKKWSEVSYVSAPYDIHLENIYRTLYAKLAPDEPPLPASWSYRLTTVSQRGDGIQGTGEVLLMPDGYEIRTFELLVTDKVYVVITESDSEREGHPWVFTVHAPSVAALELAVEELTHLLPPMPESKTSFAGDDRKEVQHVEKIVESENSVRPNLFMSIVPASGTFLSSLKDHLEKLPGITNLKNDFLYNLAECYCEYDEVHFDFKNYHFSVYDNNEAEKDEWNFYVEGAECPDDILSEVADHCQLVGKRID